MASLLYALLLLLLLTRQSVAQYLALELWGCHEPGLDGIYVCSSAGSCSLNGGNSLAPSLRTVHRLDSSGNTQKRWYLYPNATTSAALYGVVQLSESPFETKTWMALTTKPVQTEQPGMVLRPLPHECLDGDGDAPQLWGLVAMTRILAGVSDAQYNHNFILDPMLIDCLLRLLAPALSVPPAPPRVAGLSLAAALDVALQRSNISSPSLLPVCVAASRAGLPSKLVDMCFWSMTRDTWCDVPVASESAADWALSCFRSGPSADECCLRRAAYLHYLQYLLGASLQPQFALFVSASLLCSQEGDGPGQGHWWRLVLGAKSVANALLGGGMECSTCRHEPWPPLADAGADACEWLQGYAKTFSHPSVLSALQHACSALPGIIEMKVLRYNQEAGRQIPTYYQRFAANLLEVGEPGSAGSVVISNAPRTWESDAGAYTARFVQWDLARTCVGGDEATMAALSIHRQIWLLWQHSNRHRGAGELRALLLMVLLQVASPVVSLPPPLTDSPSCPIPPSTREILADALSIVSRVCQGWCGLGDVSITVGVRGLFLLAYQKPPLAHLLREAEAWYARDFVVPGLYADIVGLHETLAVKDEASVESSGGGDVAEGRGREVTVVGFISSFFFRHSVGRLLAQVILGLAQRFPSLQVHVVDLSRPSAKRHDDDLTTVLEEGLGLGLGLGGGADGGRYHRLSCAEPAACAEGVRGLGLDVAVFGDVFMDSTTALTALHRVAPVVVAFWGHPFTTGFSTVDYFVSSALFEPETAAEQQWRAEHFSEQLVLFDSLSLSMFPPASHPDPASASVPASASQRQSSREGALQSLAKGSRTLAGTAAEAHSNGQLQGLRFYGCLQSVFKLHPTFDLAVAGVLLADPQAVVVLQGSTDAMWMDRLKTRLVAALRAAVSPSSSTSSTSLYSLSSLSSPNSSLRETETVALWRLASRVWIAPQMPQAQYAASVCSMHVTLDPFPFGGGVTLVDSLSCEVPVPFVTAAALQTVHRLGAGFVAALGLGAEEEAGAGAAGSDCAYPLGVDSSASTLLPSRPLDGAAVANLTSALVRAYAQSALHLATRMQACVGRGTPAEDEEALLARHRARVKAVFYDDSTSAVAEWAAFLHRVRPRRG